MCCKHASSFWKLLYTIFRLWAIPRIEEKNPTLLYGRVRLAAKAAGCKPVTQETPMVRFHPRPPVVNALTTFMAIFLTHN